MKESEIKIIYDALNKFGDNFWTDEIETLVEDNPISSNKELFHDILSCLHKDGYDLKLVKLENNPEVEKNPERDFNLIAETNINKLSSGWQAIVNNRTKEFICGTFVDFGFAEECIGLLEFKKSETESIYEIGVGECLRPYDQLYLGEDCNMASKIFIDTINKLKQ